MIVLKTSAEMLKMKEACLLSAKALALGGELVQVGITTQEIDHNIRKFIVSCGAKPSFLNYGGFPASACISVNNEVIHGIPGKKKILAGDIVSIDVGAFYNGYHGDNAATFPAGEVSQPAMNLMEATKQSLYEGIKMAKAGNRIGDISAAVQKYAQDRNYGVVRKFVGHGVGTNLHEDPEVPNFGKSGHGLRLIPGMTLAIEPMINQGSADVKVLNDRWTTVTVDGLLSAHFEHTIWISEDGPVILTTI